MSLYININLLPNTDSLNNNDIFIITVNNKSKYITALSLYLNLKCLNIKIDSYIKQAENISLLISNLIDTEIIISNDIINALDIIDKINPEKLNDKINNISTSLSLLNEQLSNQLEVLNTDTNLLKNKLSDINIATDATNLLSTAERIENISIENMYLSVIDKNVNANFYGGVLYKVDKPKDSQTPNIISTGTVNNGILTEFITTCDILYREYNNISDDYAKICHDTNDLSTKHNDITALLYNNIHEKMFNINIA